MGIGKSLAWQILQAGGNVVVTGRNADRLTQLEQEWSSYAQHLLTVQLDVADEMGQIALMLNIQQRFGRLDVLINNAGLSAFGDLVTTDKQVIHAIIDTNIKGLLFTTQAALPLLAENKGTVLFISSLAGLYGLPGYSLYALSKMALTALRQSLATEMAASGVNVAIAYVGFTANEAEKRTLQPDGQEAIVPSRHPALTFSREATAKQLLHQIASGKKILVQGAFGKLTFVLAKYFPALLRQVLARNYRQNSAR